MSARRWTVAALLAAVGVAAALRGGWFAGQGDGDGLVTALTGRGAVVWARAGEVPVAMGQVPGVRMQLARPGGAVARALAGTEPRALVEALREAGQAAVLVDAGAAASSLREGSVAAQLAGFARVEGLRGLYLAPDVALYGVDPWQDLGPRLKLALSTVARGVLAGQRPPRLSSFPEPLRRVQHVEVMVMLRAGPRPRLWRSARGSSVAQALLTAVRVARTRWAERQQAMGEALSTALPKLAVDVSLLQDDGRFGSRDAAFIERVFGPQHGVAYERKGAWRYLLPAATREAGEGHAMVAYDKLLREEGLERASLAATDLHPYRLAVNVLASSPAPAEARGAAPVHRTEADAGVGGGSIPGAQPVRGVSDAGLR